MGTRRVDLVVMAVKVHGIGALVTLKVTRHVLTKISLSLLFLKFRHHLDRKFFKLFDGELGKWLESIRFPQSKFSKTTDANEHSCFSNFTPVLL